MSEGPEDDWFSGPEVRLAPEQPGSPVEDDWLEEEFRPRPARSGDLAALLNRRVLVPAAVLIALLIGILAAAGVFNGGSPTTSPPTTTTTTTTTTPATVKPATTPAVRAVVAVPSVPLKPGASGAQVKLLQRALASLGYSTGAVDGQYGPATTQAVTGFQRARGLTADGVFGPKTRQALTAALAAHR